MVDWEAGVDLGDVGEWFGHLGWDSSGRSGGDDGGEEGDGGEEDC